MIRINVLIVTRSLEVIRLETLIYEVERNVHLCTLSIQLPIVSIVPLVPSGVERPPVMPVQGHEQHVLILLHNVLCAVTMVYVPVYYRHPLLLPFL